MSARDESNVFADFSLSESAIHPLLEITSIQSHLIEDETSLKSSRLSMEDLREYTPKSGRPAVGTPQKTMSDFTMQSGYIDQNDSDSACEQMRELIGQVQEVCGNSDESDEDNLSDLLSQVRQACGDYPEDSSCKMSFTDGVAECSRISEFSRSLPRKPQVQRMELSEGLQSKALANSQDNFGVLPRIEYNTLLNEDETMMEVRQND